MTDAITQIDVQGDEIAVLSLKSGNQLNLLHGQTLKDLYEIILKLQLNSTIKVLVIAPRGDRCFSAGADIKELLNSNLEIEEYVYLGDQLMQAIFEFPVPVIAAVNGFALGAGFSLALACEFRFMSKQAKMGQLAVKNGLIPPFGNIQHLIQTIGYHKTRELIYTGKILSAQEALEFGMVNQICESDTLQEQVLEFAKSIAQHPSFVVKKLKKIINATLMDGFTRGNQLQQEALIDCLNHPETRELLIQFFEKKSG